MIVLNLFSFAQLVIERTLFRSDLQTTFGHLARMAFIPRQSVRRSDR